MEKISFLIYKILRTIDLLLNYLAKKSFLIFFNDFFNKDFYTFETIKNKKINFFIPNQVTKWRVKTLYTKEPETLEWIDSFKSKNGKPIIFWDVGANIGLYSIYAASVHKNILIYSFEPSTSNLRVLSRNISINNLSEKISIAQFPLGQKNFQFSNINEQEFKEGWSMSSYGEPINYEGKKFEPTQKYKIFGLSIDYLISNKILETPNYIKIDVDGIEDEILLGGIKNLKNEVLTSVSIELNENYKSQFDSVINTMQLLNLKIKHKKHAQIYENDEKFSKLYNFVFEK
jgi:FkbM family methyltransferase